MKTIEITVNEQKKKSRIRKEIYGQFAEHLGRGIYEGLFVRPESGIPNEDGIRTDVADALREIKVPVIRWPGGCFADEYHWMDGIGPLESRKKIINTNWGGVLEDNSFGTHEFFHLCEMLGCEAYVNGNIGSGTVKEMEDWMEYITFDGESPMSRLRAENGRREPWKMKFFGLGNESWGCGGNMFPEDYAARYRLYQSFLHDSQKVPAEKIAVGPAGDDYDWTEKLLEKCYRRNQPQRHGFMDGLSVHYYMYLRGWEDKGSALSFTDEEWVLTMQRAYFLKEILEKHAEILDRYDPEKKIGLVVDEWGNWFWTEEGTNPGFLYQQNSMRDAVSAGLNLNVFNKMSDRITMTNIAQMINVLQSMLLTQGAELVKTPTYFVYRMFRDHQDADLLESVVSGNYELSVLEDDRTAPAVPVLSESVSMNEKGEINLTLTNQSTEDDLSVRIHMNESKPYTATLCEILQGESSSEDPHGLRAHNSFEEPEQVQIRPYSQISKDESGFALTLPAASVVHLTLQKN